MSTKYAYAIHEIVRKRSDGKAGTETVPASSKGVSSVFKTDEAELKLLVSLGAAREATEDEAIVYKSRNPSAESKPATPLKGKAASKDDEDI